MESPTRTAIIVEDEYVTADALSMLVQAMGVNVVGIAHNAEDGERMALELEPDIVFMDVRLGPGRDGVDVSNHIKSHIDPRIIYVTGSGEPATMERISTNHPFRVLLKPYSADDLREAITATEL